MNLRDKIFDCLPAGRYALSGLLRLLDIVETEAIPTAAVECHAQPRLLVNPSFVAAHAETPQKLMMLVLHEVHHVLLGHTRRFSTATPSDNFVFDCVINALLCRMFPQPEYTALFRDFYAEDAFPACLLRPPEGWNPRTQLVPVPPGLEGDGLAPARQVYQELYSTVGASYDDIRHVLHAFLEKLEADIGDVPLLGDHDGSAQGSATESSEILARAVAGIVRQWPSPPDPLKGISMADILRDSRLAVRRTPSPRRQLRDLIASVARATEAGRGARRLVETETGIETPLPGPDRRAMVRRALGATPLLYRSELRATQPLPAQERVHVYVDVSGSMEGLKGALYGAVLDCEAVVHPKVHLFSTEIADVGLAELRAGICRSTDGTDINCVTRHMALHRVRRAVLLTDGYVGYPDAAGLGVLGRSRIGVAYIGHVTTAEPLGHHARSSINLQLDT